MSNVIASAAEAGTHLDQAKDAGVSYHLHFPSRALCHISVPGATLAHSGVVMRVNRRRFAVAGGAVLSCSALLGTASQLRAAGDADPVKVVDRWLNEIVRQGVTDHIDDFVRSDVVVVLHGLGANEDGTPRRIEGLAAVRDWIAQVVSLRASQPELRIDDRLVDGNKVAFRGRNVWTLQSAGGPVKMAQSLAVFYYVEAGSIYLIERYVDRIRRKVN
jgi:SnoaL-like domain